jgi:hypothetical protein
MLAQLNRGGHGQPTAAMPARRLQAEFLLGDITAGFWATRSNFQLRGGMERLSGDADMETTVTYDPIKICPPSQGQQCSTQDFPCQHSIQRCRM